MGTMDVALGMVAMNTPVIAICYAGPRSRGNSGRFLGREAGA